MNNRRRIATRRDNIVARNRSDSFAWRSMEPLNIAKIDYPDHRAT
jgi:hypothetical protein